MDHGYLALSPSFTLSPTLLRVSLLTLDRRYFVVHSTTWRPFDFFSPFLTVSSLTDSCIFAV